MPDSSPLLISTLPPPPGQRRVALAVGLGLLAFFVAVLPFASVKLPRSELLIPIVSTIMFLGDCITAVLLFGQFAVLRSRALLVLAGGYLFTGLLVVAYALTFPGAFSEGGVLMAGLQTAAWIFVFWHLGLPVTVIAYALLRDLPGDREVVRSTPSSAIAVTVGMAVLLAAIVAALAIRFHDLLPVVVFDPMRLSRHVGVAATVVIVSVAAFVLLLQRRRSILDLWLLVVLFAWVLDALFTWMTETRFTGGWYANRVVRIVSANVVLFALLAESTRLYARLASSVIAQRREREARTLSMEAMAAAIEHEIRQPLGAIAANADAARLWLDQSPPNPSAARAALGEVADDVQRANENLRSIRKLFASRDRDPQPIDANELIEDTVALVRFELESLAIGVQLQLTARLPPVAVDRVQLQEVIVNLVNNAVESMRGLGDHAAVLQISSGLAAADRVEITVADMGPGIAPEDLDRIFEPFFTTKPEGMGMGLAICRNIAERHGGTISASRGTPYGSVFRLALPCR